MARDMNLHNLENRRWLFFANPFILVLLNKLRRYLPWIIFTPILLLGIGLLMANLYVQSEPMHEMMRTEIESSIGMPVKITQTGVSPWNGLTVKGVAVEDPNAVAPFLAVQRFRIQFRLTELMRGRFIVSVVHVEQPAVLWSEHSDGGWRLPYAEKPITPLAMSDSDPQSFPLPEIEPAPAIPSSGPAVESPIAELSEPSPPHPPFRIRIHGGSAMLKTAKGRPVFEFSGLDVDTRVNPNEEFAMGNISIAEAGLPGKLKAKSVEANVFYQNPSLIVNDISASIAGGIFSGAFTLDDQIPQNLHLSGAIVDADFGVVLEEMGMSKGRGSGKLNAGFALKGPVANTDAWLGRLDVNLRDGMFRDHPLLAPIGRALSINELTDMPLNKAVLLCELADNIVHVRTANLQANRISLAAEGTVDETGALDLQARLIIDAEIANRLPGMLRQPLVTDAATGEMHLPFSVGGTIDNPTTTLLDEMMRRAVGSGAGRLLDRMRGRSAPENAP